MTDQEQNPKPAPGQAQPVPQKPAGIDRGEADRKAGARPEVQGRRPQSHGKAQTG